MKILELKSSITKTEKKNHQKGLTVDLSWQEKKSVNLKQIIQDYTI